MAKIAFLDHNQKSTDKPRRFEKRSQGQSIVRRALAYWIVENVLAQMYPPGAGRSEFFPNSYIPETLPPAEIFGVKFTDPVKRSGAMLGFTRCWMERQ